MEHLEKLRNEILKINMDEISDSYKKGPKGLTITIEKK